MKSIHHLSTLILLAFLTIGSAKADFKLDSYDIYEYNVGGDAQPDLVFIARQKTVLVGTEILTPIT